MSPVKAPLQILDASADARVAFLGRPEAGDAEVTEDRLTGALDRLREALGQTAPATGVENRQVHSARCVEARAPTALRPEADALWTRERGLALAVYTADCVPVLFAGPTTVAAAHAGWRGLASGVLDATLATLPDPPHALTAWIGPAIGACCYQVSEEVAHAVAAASTSRARIERAPRPHLDLPGAARAQLERAGVRDLREISRCTRCQRERLWSYRGHGATGRRNYALVWRHRA